jgi:hypothetical protein
MGCVVVYSRPVNSPDHNLPVQFVRSFCVEDDFIFLAGLQPWEIHSCFFGHFWTGLVFKESTALPSACPGIDDGPPDVEILMAAKYSIVAWSLLDDVTCIIGFNDWSSCG